MNKGGKLVKLLLPLAVWLGVWQLLALWVGQPLLLPTPWETAVRLGKLVPTWAFWKTCLTTLGRVFLGASLGSLVGTITAALSARFAWVDWLTAPVMKVVRATPVASFIVLIWLWCTSTWVPVVISALMSAPVVWAATAQGISATDPRLLELASAYRFSGWKTVRLVYLPSVRPALAAGCKTAMGLAWKAGVAAEALCRPRWAMGTQVWGAKLYLETADLFAWTAAVVVLSFAVEKGLWALLERRGSGGNS